MSTEETIEKLFLSRKNFTRVTSCKKACSICTGLQRKFGKESPYYSKETGRKSRTIHSAWYRSDAFNFHYDGLSKRMRIDFN